MKAEYLDHMGDDLSIVNAARVSFDKESKWEDGWQRRLSKRDVKLVKYLSKYHHWTPFAHTSVSLRMSAPVPIRTQCFKHKAGFVENEESRRYISTKPEIYIPDVFRSSAENVKQGSGGEHPDSDVWRGVYRKSAELAVLSYMSMIEDGICPEQARFILPQGAIVNWIWTGNLASFSRFYNERTYDKAQKEVQDLAYEVEKIISPLFPVSWEALTTKESV